MKLLDSFFRDIQNNQGLGKGYQPQPITPMLTLDKTNHKSSDNCLLTQPQLIKGTNVISNVVSS